jgi:hypothetical protein
MFALPLQVIDTFLQQYHMGHVFLFLLVLGILGTLPLKSKTVTGLLVVTFGLLFMVTPLSMMNGDFVFRAIAIALLFAGPMIIVVGD